MPETKKYAILCSTEEQARECIEKLLHCFIYRRGKTIILPEGYTIITYEEAVEKGLLGEKEEKYKSIHDPCPYGNDDCPKCNPKKEEVKEESKIEELSDKIHRMRAGRYVTQKYNMSDDNFERREKQAQTKYKDLSEEDKEKDRKFAREILDIINK